MAIILADLKVVLDGDTPATGKIQAADRAVSDFGQSVDRADGPTGSFLGKVAGGALSFAQAVPGISMMVGGIADLATGMISGNAEFERYETQFGVLLGSADKAKERLAELAKFGATTPFELPELVKADKVLTAFGLDSEDTAAKFGVSAAQIRTTIGDVAAGTGASFEELAGTFGKFASGATGDAIARFQEMGIATKEEMASWGLEFNKAGQLVTPAKEAFSVLESHVRDKFGGMMQAQSGTFEGMVSNLQDWIGATQRQLMAPLFEVLKDKLQGVLTFLGSAEVQAAMSGFAEGLATGLGVALDVLGRLGEIVGPLIGLILPMVQAFLGLGTAGEGMAGPLGSAGELLGLISDNLSTITDVITSVISGFSEGGLAGAFNSLTALAPTLLGALQQIGFDIANQAVEWALQLTKWVGDAVPGVVEGLASFGAAIFNWITSEGIPRAAEFLLNLAQTFIDFIVPAIPGVVAQLQEWGSALLSWILNEGIPQAFNMLVTLGQKFVDWVGPNVPPLLEALGGMFASMIGWIIGTALPMIISKLLEWGKAFVDWLGPNVPILLGKLGELLSQLGGWLINTALPDLLSNLQKWGQAFIDWVGPQIPPLLEALGGLLGQLTDWVINEAIPGAIEALVGLGSAFFEWVGKDALPFIAEELNKFGAALFEWINQTAVDIVEQAADIGANLIEGIVDGLKNAGNDVVDFLLNLMGDAVDAVKNFFGIQSPSTLMRDMFADDVLGGAVLGAKEGTPAVVRGMRQAMEATVTATEGFGPALARNILPTTDTSAVGRLSAASGTSSGASVMINAPITINGLTGDIINPETWKLVIRPILQAAQSYLGPNVILTRTI